MNNDFTALVFKGGFKILEMLFYPSAKGTIKVRMINQVNAEHVYFFCIVKFPSNLNSHER